MVEGYHTMKRFSFLIILALLGVMGCNQDVLNVDEYDSEIAKAFRDQLAYDFKQDVDWENWPSNGDFTFGIHSYSDAILIGDMATKTTRITNYGEHRIRIELYNGWDDFSFLANTPVSSDLTVDDLRISIEIPPQSYAEIMVNFHPTIDPWEHGSGEKYTYADSTYLDIAVQAQGPYDSEPAWYILRSVDRTISLFGAATEPDCPIAQISGFYQYWEDEAQDYGPSYDVNGESVMLPEWLVKPGKVIFTLHGNESESVFDDGFADTWQYEWNIYHNPDGSPFSSPSVSELEPIETKEWGSTLIYIPEECGSYLITLTVTDEWRESCRPARLKFDIPCN